MKKKIFTLLIGAVAFIGLNATVIFDPAEFAGTLPDGMAIVDTAGAKYLRIILNEWNSNFTLPEAVYVADNENKYKFTACYNAGSSGFEQSKTNMFVQPVSADWSVKFPFGTASSPTFIEYTTDITPGAEVAIIQFAGQETISWGAVKGGVLYIGKIESYEVVVDEAKPPVTITIEKSSASVEIDGVEDAAWAPVPKNLINKLATGSVSNDNDNSGYFKTTWDAENLYLFVSVTDNDPIGYTGGTMVWENDGIELYLDAKDRRVKGGARLVNEQHQIRVNLDRVEADQGGFGDYPMTFAQTSSATGYTFEFAIPWSGIANGTDALVDDFTGDKNIAFEISILDADALDHRKSILNWSNNTGTDVAYNTNEYYGRITLSNKLVGIQSNSVSSLKVYPNPTADRLYVNAKSIRNLEIIDLNGKIVKQTSNYTPAGFDISGLASGVYFLKVSQNSNSQLIKLIKK